MLDDRMLGRSHGICLYLVHCLDRSRLGSLLFSRQGLSSGLIGLSSGLIGLSSGLIVYFGQQFLNFLDLNLVHGKFANNLDDDLVFQTVTQEVEVVSGILSDIVVGVVDEGADVENDLFLERFARTGSLVDFLGQTLERDIEGVSDLNGLAAHVLLDESEHFGFRTVVGQLVDRPADLFCDEGGGVD